MECEHKFDDERVCIYCALETHPLLTLKRPKDSYEYKRHKKNVLATIQDLEDLNLDDIGLSAYEMYQQVTENKLYRSKMRKSILCVCICKA